MTVKAEELLHQARGGDAEALGQLFDLYRSYFTLYSRLQIGPQLRGKVSPSDLVQDTFLQAHGDFKSFRGCTEAELVEWLRKILVFRLARVVRQYYRTQRRNVLREEQLEPDGPWPNGAASLVSPKSSPSQEATRHEEALRLANALAQLPQEYREVIILRSLEEEPFNEVAKRMGRSEEAVKKTWARALAALRKVMGKPTL